MTKDLSIENLCGGAWKNKAKQNIYEYLTEELKEYADILVIA